MSTHTLVIEGEVFYADDDPEHDEPLFDDREYTVECPGVDDACMGWEECSTCHPWFKGPVFMIGAPDDDLLDQLEQTGEAHGEYHRYIDGRWMTETGRCYVAHHDTVYECAWEIESEKGPLPAGRYAVDFDVPDETDLHLFLVGPTG